MSELAFNINGERFQPPGSASFWRVRRLKPGGRGTPDVVFGRDGTPLTVPVDAEVAEFRRLVRNEPGRYRLDPIDDQHKPCDGGAPAYLQISDGSSPTVADSEAVRDDLLSDIVRTNSEMVKCIAEKFASVMESAAVLLRAADGAGLPAREPAVLPPRNADANNESKDDEDDEDESPLHAVVLSCIDKVMPLVNHTISTKVMGLTPEQSIAMMGGTVPASPPPTGSSPASSAAQPQAAEPADPAPPPAAASGRAPDFVAHLTAIDQLLSPEESELARQAVKEMPPETLTAWRERLLQLSAEEAAELIRTEIKGGSK